MVRALLSAAPVDGGTCPEVHAYAASAGALNGRRVYKDHPRLLSPPPSDHVLEVERAVLSPSGDEAIVYVAGDVGNLIYYRKQADGRWRETAQTTVWVS